MDAAWPKTIAFLACLAFGCSDDRVKTYPVRGVVRFADGEPVRFGTVELLSEEHRLNARGAIQRDGTFVLGTYAEADGAAAGRHQAVVVQFVAVDAAPGVDHDHGALVAPRFSDYATSDLNVLVEPGRNDVELVVAPREGTD